MKVLIAILILVPALSFAKAAKVDWKPCKKDLEEFCTTATSDLEKHQCLEEIPKGKGSKACLEHNKKVEALLGHKHEDGHKH